MEIKNNMKNLDSYNRSYFPILLTHLKLYQETLELKILLGNLESIMPLIFIPMIQNYLGYPWLRLR